MKEEEESVYRSVLLLLLLLSVCCARVQRTALRTRLRDEIENGLRFSFRLLLSSSPSTANTTKPMCCAVCVYVHKLTIDSAGSSFSSLLFHRSLSVRKKVQQRQQQQKRHHILSSVCATAALRPYVCSVCLSAERGKEINLFATYNVQANGFPLSLLSAAAAAAAAVGI